MDEKITIFTEPPTHKPNEADLLNVAALRTANVRFSNHTITASTFLAAA
jgi:hypothetical protein